MSVEEACDFFANQRTTHRILSTVKDVGLGYIRLGQPATPLSGGEAQRVKLATELAKQSTGQTLYILDEPTTGLHFEDIRKLLEVLNKLADRGNTLIIIEHNLEVIKSATLNSAQTLRQEKLGLVRPGYIADLALVDGNPAYNLRFLYSFGALTLDENGEMIRTRGVVHTIKDGIVTNNSRLMEEVARMVKNSKRGIGPDAVTEPFIIK